MLLRMVLLAVKLSLQSFKVILFFCLNSLHDKFMGLSPWEACVHRGLTRKELLKGMEGRALEWLSVFVATDRKVLGRMCLFLLVLGVMLLLLGKTLLLCLHFLMCLSRVF